MPSADIHILTDRSGAGLPPEVATRLLVLFEFLACDAAARAKIQNAAQFIPLKADDPIFYAGELHGVVWWVLAGEVGFYRGTQRLFSVAANDVLALRPLEVQVPFRYNVAASAEAWVMRLPLMIFEQCQQDGQVAAAALRDSVSDVVAAYLETRDAPALERLLIGPLFRGLKPAAAQRLIQRLPAEQFAANSVCEIDGRAGMRPDLLLLESGVVTLTLFGPDARAKEQANAPDAEQVLMQTDLHPGDMVPAPALAGAPGFRITLIWLTAGRLRKLDCTEFIASHCPRLLPEVDVEKASTALAAGTANLLDLHGSRSAASLNVGQRETISLADLPGASSRLAPRRPYILAADSESEALFAGLYLLGRGLRVQLLALPPAVQGETYALGSNAGVLLAERASPSTERGEVLAVQARPPASPRGPLPQSENAGHRETPFEGEAVRGRATQAARNQGAVNQARPDQEFPNQAAPNQELPNTASPKQPATSGLSANQTAANQPTPNSASGTAPDSLEALIARFQADLRAQLAVEAQRERDRLAQAWARAVTEVQREADARVQARVSELERNERSALRAAEERLEVQHRELDALRQTLDAERAEVAAVRRIFEEKLAAATALQAEVLAMRERLTGQLHDLWPPTPPRGES